MTTGRARGRSARANRVLLEQVRERSINDEGSIVASLTNPRTSCADDNCTCQDPLVDASPRPQPASLEALRRQRFQRSLVAAAANPIDPFAAQVADVFAMTKQGQLPPPEKMQTMLDAYTAAGGKLSG